MTFPPESFLVSFWPIDTSSAHAGPVRTDIVDADLMHIYYAIAEGEANLVKIQKQLQAVGADPEARSGLRRDVENAFMKRTMVEDSTSITPKDLTITKEGDGFVVSAEYTTCVPVVANLRAALIYPGERYGATATGTSALGSAAIGAMASGGTTMAPIRSR